MCVLPAMTLSRGAVDFIDDALLEGLLTAPRPTASEIDAIIAKSLNKDALSVEETARLLLADEPEMVERIFQAARQLKKDVYGNRIVLFAPVYVGNHCINDCRYCGFQRSNKESVRQTLTEPELRQQIEALENKGHKRLILVFGEHPNYDGKYIASCVRAVYSVKVGHGEIRRVNINAAPMDVENYRIIKEANIGTYQIFQESYHHATYAQYHPANTRKGNFHYRLDGQSRAMEAGIDDVGIGALFGLYDWRYEVLGLVTHARYMQERHGVGPHTISFPRLRPASGVNLDDRDIVNDDQLKRIIAVLRLAVPYTGLILTARENPELRREALAFGVSQIDAGSRVEIGGYTMQGDSQVMEREQFCLGDIRPLDIVMRELLQNGYIPSFCTSCYRLGRTGEHFMEYAIPGFIQKFCTPNALTTLAEYLVDYASPATRLAGEQALARELEKMPDSPLKQTVLERLNRIRTTDQRDLYF